MYVAPIFKQLLIHEKSSEDGYKFLYAVMCDYHLRLVERDMENYLL